MNNTLNKANNGKVAGVITALNIAYMCNVVPVLAENYGVWNGAVTTITGHVNTLKAALVSIVAPIAGLILIICLIGMAISQDKQKVASFKSWGIRAFLCVVGSVAINFIITLAQTLGQTLQ